MNFLEKVKVNEMKIKAKRYKKDEDKKKKHISK